MFSCCFPFSSSFQSSSSSSCSTLSFCSLLDINEGSVEHTLRLIHPKMEALLLLAKKVQLIEPLRELKLNDADAGEFFSAEYIEILAKSEELQAEFKRQPCHLERLYGEDGAGKVMLFIYVILCLR